MVLKSKNCPGLIATLKSTALGLKQLSKILSLAQSNAYQKHHVRFLKVVCKQTDTYIIINLHRTAFAVSGPQGLKPAYNLLSFTLCTTIENQRDNDNNRNLLFKLTDSSTITSIVRTDDHKSLEDWTVRGAYHVLHLI